MARYAYDVNSRTKLLDAHKQFMGGLKTVDTDDSLRTLYLRNMENLSLSEYGFLEKRYGQYVEETLKTSTTTTHKIQGYFEYKKDNDTTHKIMMINGQLYRDYADGNGLQIATGIYKEDTDNFVYPTDGALTDIGFSILNSAYGYTNNSFQTTREIEAARIDDTMYIMTGQYPVYYNGDGKFYLLPIYKVTPDDLAVFSHNLMEEDFATYYHSTTFTSDNLPDGDFSNTASSYSLEYIKQYFLPRLPYTGQVLKLGASFNIEIPYTDFEFFDSGSPDYTPNTTASGKFVEYRVNEVYRRGAGGGEDAWQLVPSSEYTQYWRHNDNGADGVFAYDEDNAEYELPENTTEAYDTSTYMTTTTEPAMVVNLLNQPNGYFDYKMVVELKETRYETVPTKIDNVYQDVDTLIETVRASSDVVFRDITIYIEKLEDYLDYEKYNGQPDLWSANKVLVHYGKLLAYGTMAAPQKVYVSHPEYRNYFPFEFMQDFTTDYRDPVVQITPFMNILVVQTDDYTWGLKGTGPTALDAAQYSAFTISPLYGAVAPKSVRPVRNQLFFLSKEGIMSLNSLYAVDEQYNVKPVDLNIQNIVPRGDTGAVGIQYDDQYWINFPTTGDTFRYYMDKKAWVKDKYFNNPDTTAVFTGIHKFVRRDAGLAYISNHLKLPGEDNYGIYEMSLDKSLPYEGKSTEPFLALFETAELNQQYPFHPKQYRELKLDFQIQNEYNLGMEPLIDNEDLETTVVTLIPGHRYQISSGTVQLQGINIDTEDPDYSLRNESDFEEIITDVEGTDYYTYEFTYTREETYVGYILLPTQSGVVGTMSNITYDNNITFSVWAVGDGNTLNIDNIDSYTPDLADIDTDLGTRDGTWVFGQTPFGNLISAVKTVRLSGKSKNIKVYFEDISKSKWTLETLGIVFKIKRARGTR